jgi:DNA-binding NarL/FixJ family response regulator
MMRDGIALLLDQQPDLEVVGFAGTGEEGVAQFFRLKPDITLMDLQLPGMSGFAAIHAIREKRPDARIVVLTMYDGDEDIHRALTAGAAAYVLKDMLSDELVGVIHAVCAGEHPLPDHVRNQLESRAKQPALTERERQVMELLGLGKRNKEIAVILGITEDTIKVHLKNIFTKLAVTDRTAALSVALRRGIIHIP